MITKTPRNDQGYYDVIVTDRHGKKFMMTVGGNLDLFWIPQNHRENRTFEIDSEDQLNYQIFDQLFCAITRNDDRYNPIVDGNTITFISEDWPEDEANLLQIVKSNNLYTLNFIENENKSAWSFPHRGCNICFCNSGSRIPKVESLFMRLFNFLAYECDLIECEDDQSNKPM